jgi:hypothetical protein
MSISELMETGELRRRTPHHSTKPTSSHTASEPSIALVREDIYAILSADETMGFVERVGNVFVSLDGPDLARAVEVGQSLSWDKAVTLVRRAYYARG